MLTTLDLINQLKAKLGSDYRTAKIMNVKTQRISQLRNRGGVFTDEQGLIVAKTLDLPYEYVLLNLVAERSKNSPAHHLYHQIADKFMPASTAAAALLMGFFGGVILRGLELGALTT